MTGSGADETVWLAVQREWKDDPKGFVKLLAYKPATKDWGVVHYPLDKAAKGWIGLSEITAVGDGLVVIERDNQVGRDAKVKKLTFVSLEGVTPAPLGGELPVVAEDDRPRPPPRPRGARRLRRSTRSRASPSTRTATPIVITDNDGVDDHSGETFFLASARSSRRSRLNSCDEGRSPSSAGPSAPSPAGEKGMTLAADDAVIAENSTPLPAGEVLRGGEGGPSPRL